MKSLHKILIFTLSLIFIAPSLSHAVWIWTPQTGKFINPKMAVKSTPREQLDYAIAFMEGKKYAQAMAELKKLVKNYPRAKEAPEAQYYTGLILEKLDKPYDAFKAYQIVIDKYPFSERAAEIVGLQFNIANDLLEGKDKKGKWVEAIIGGDDRITEIFRAVIKNAPYGKFAAEAQYKMGLYLKERALYQEARDEFEKTMGDYPNTEWAKAAKFQIAMADSERASSVQHEQKTTSIALDEFKEFVKSHPNSDLTPQAKQQIAMLREKEAESAFMVAKFYEKQKNYKSAAVYYQNIVSYQADTQWATRALKRLRAIGGKLK
jgi:outer membrane protein assembly factor BamD